MRHVFMVVAVYRSSPRPEGRTLSPKLSTWPVSAPAVAASEIAGKGGRLMKACLEAGRISGASGPTELMVCLPEMSSQCPLTH